MSEIAKFTNPWLRTISYGPKTMAVLFILALVVRLILISHFSAPPVNDLLWNDAVGWNLAQGNGFTASQTEPRVPGIYRTPGYPVFLAILYRIFGHSYAAVYVAQSILDAASTILIGRIVLLYFNPWMSVFTSFLYAVYPYPGMFCGVIHQDILLTFFVLLTLLFVCNATRSDRLLPWLFTGFMLGITALIKPNFALFIILPITTIIFYFRHGKILRSAVVLGSLMLTLFPWFWRNYTTFHRFPPLSAGATGLNFQLLLHELEGGEEDVRAVGLAKPRTSIDNFQDGLELIDSQKQQTEQAVKKLMTRWPEYFLLVLKHFPRLWITKYSRWYGESIALVGTVLSWIVFGGGIIGMFLLRKNWRKLLPLYLTVSLITLMYAPYTAEARYTLPARPVMLCFLAATLSYVLQRIRPTLTQSAVTVS